jgi:hypothetical protein
LAQRQVNIRISEAEFKVLAAAAFLDGVNPPDLLRPIVEGLVEELGADPDVIAALQAKRARDEKKTPKNSRSVSSLDAKRRRAGGRDA